LDERSLQLIEYGLVTAAIAARASCERAAERLRSWRPIADRAERAAETACLHEALRRDREPGQWCFAAPGDLGETLTFLQDESPEGAALLVVLGWLSAAAATADAWADPEVAQRHPRLAGRARGVPAPGGLRERLSASLDDEGRVKDGASPALKRLRAGAAAAEKHLAAQLERWARGFGSEAYVTRHAERFVVMVPAAGFPRRRAIVHDVSASGQSLLVEPLESCAENNRMIEAQRAAGEEERRVLAALAAEVLAARAALEAMEEALVHLDTLRARARWGREVGAVALEPGGDALRLESARHPLLAMGVGAPDGVVPLDLELHTARVPGRILLVSGPNMGGKTVLLKTAGLAVALASSALPVPAGEGSVVPEIDRIVVDIGDEQSLAQGLSTFAAHLKALGEMAAAAGPRTLLLADELGAGTDPEDGAALARALLEHAARRETWAVATTHLGSLKRLAGEVPGIENGSLEFDLETLEPRFRFLPGVPGASHAQSVAARLGFPADVLARARALRPESAHALERLMAGLADATRAVRAEREALAEARRQAEVEADRLHQATEESRRELAALRRRLTRESEVLLGRARELWQTAQREARREERTRSSAEALRRELAGLEREVDALQQATGTEGPPPTLSAGAITPGARVRVLDLGVEAEVVSGPDPEGRVHLRRGSWNIQSHVGRLAEAGGASTPARPVAGTWSVPEGVPLEVDLRGMDAADALAALDQGIDRAVLAGFTEVRVIHGIGRGILRGVVEKHLREHPQVGGQRPGEVGEGGRGVTIARLR
jgi:DNA mismatch repair protein MutS2